MNAVNQTHEAIYRQAKELLSKMGPIDPRDDIGLAVACRAILAERERCAAVARSWKSSFRPGNEQRRLGHDEASADIADAILKSPDRN